MKEIPLTQGKVALVDDEDFEELSKYKWYAKRKLHRWYAERSCRRINGRRPCIKMHRVIMPGFAMLDHCDGDGLNNQKSNLRPCTNQQNQMNSKGPQNTSGFKGVSRIATRSERWGAQIKAGGKRIYLGSYADKGTAAKAYDQAALKYFGEFARLNFRV